MFLDCLELLLQLTMLWRMVELNKILLELIDNHLTLGLEKSVTEASLGWLLFMGALYITGALFYAFRIPERFFPGKVDIWVKKKCKFWSNVIMILFLVSQSSNISLFCDSRSFCSLSWNFKHGHLQVID